MPAIPASEAESTLTRSRARRTAPHLPRLLVLSGLTAVAAIALWYGFVQGNSAYPPMPGSARLLWLVVLALAASAVAARLMPYTRESSAGLMGVMRRLNSIPLAWHLLATACIVSFVVGQVANSEPAPKDYWPLFFIWLAVVASVAVWAITALGFWRVRREDVRLWAKAHRWELLGVAGMTAVAAALRVTNLTTIPLPFEQDEGALAHESVFVLTGDMKNMFMSGLQGHATMQFFAEAAYLKVFGINVFSIRLITAVVGVLTIPVFYVMLRQMFGKAIAVLGSAFLVGYALHIHYSRVGMENIADPFLMAATLYFAWRASRDGKLVDFVLTGLILGLGFYLSPASRVIPIIVAALFGYTFLRRRSFLRQLLPGVGVTILAFSAAALPVGIFWLTHTSFFMDRISTVSIFQSGWFDQEREAGRSALSILWDQATRSFGAFGFYSDTSIFYHGPVPLVDRLTLVPFLLGLVYAVYKVLDARYFLMLAIFGAVVVTGGVLTIQPPTSQRLLGTIPAVAAFTAIGVKLIADWASRLRPKASPVVAGVAIAALFTVNVNYYFFQYTHGGYSSDLNNRVAAQVVDYVRGLPENTRLFFYGDPRMYLSGWGHPAMTFPLRDYARLDVLQDGRVDSDPAVDLTGDAPATFMFLPERQEEMASLIQSCPGGEVVTYIMPAGRHGLQGVEPAKMSFVAYEVLTPNHCLPVTMGQQPTQ
jgi:hypothetical protein